MSWSDCVFELSGSAEIPKVAGSDKQITGKINLESGNRVSNVVKWEASYMREKPSERQESDPPPGRDSSPIAPKFSVNVKCQSSCRVYLEEHSVTILRGRKIATDPIGYSPIEVKDLPDDGWVYVIDLSSYRFRRFALNHCFFVTVHLRYRIERSYVLKSPWGSSFPAGVPTQDLVADFRKLFLSSASSDVTFQIGDESIAAHQLILSARVPYFGRLFASGMKEAATKIITIEDADVITFKELLKFVYTGELPKDLESSPETYLPLAEKYDMQDLKSRALHAMATNINRANVVNTLIMADLFDCPELKHDCFFCLRECSGMMTDEALEPLLKYPKLLLGWARSLSCP